MTAVEPEGLPAAVDAAYRQMLLLANEQKATMESHGVPPSVVATVLVSALANTIGSVLHSLVVAPNRADVVRQLSAKLHVLAMKPGLMMTPATKEDG